MPSYGSTAVAAELAAERASAAPLVPLANPEVGLMYWNVLALGMALTTHEDGLVPVPVLL